MKKLIVTLTLAPALCLAAPVKQITAAGSSFIFPVMAKWSQAYNQKTKIQINYQPIGSGGGISQLQNKTVDFAASDKPLHKAELTAKKWQQFPAVVGGIVPVINIPGVGNNSLILSGPTLANIYSSNILFWDDPQIKQLNPTVKLPHNRIITVHRADGSGTTFNFTKYLYDVSPDWHKKIGYDTVVDWPGFGLGAKGNAGVANQVQNIANSIGYVEYSYAHSSKLNMVRMLNKAGKVVTANAASFKSAARNASWKAENSFFLILTNQPGQNSWPIVATTFILLPTKNSDQRQATLAFFRWVFAKGSQLASDLDYVAIPTRVAMQIEATFK